MSAPNLLDRIVEYFNPEAGLRRTCARNALAVTSQERPSHIDNSRLYEGARPSRSNMSWFTPSTSANAEVAPALIMLRNRARDLVRNTPIGATAVDVYSSQVVGQGIRPKAATGIPGLDKQLDALWKSHCETLDIDADGRLNAYGIQAIVMAAVVESGEVLLRFRPRKAKDGLDVPLQVQVLESDFLDVTKTFLDQPGGAYTLNGIEYDKLGRRTAYWLYDQHPGNIWLLPKQAILSKRVPAATIVHVFDKKRPNQDRGASWFAPVMDKIRDLTDYENAEVIRKKIEACMAVFVTSEQDGAQKMGPEVDTPTDERVRELGPGQVSYLQPGEDVKFAAPAASASYDPYVRACLRSIAAGLGLTYEQLTGDLSNVNYSSFRAGLMQFRARAEQIRANILIPHVCGEMWKRMVDAASIAGIVPTPPGGPNYGVTWAEPAWMSVDPEKDAAAALVKIRMGTMTLSQAIAAEGYNPDDQLQAIADDYDRLDRLGIVLDCDPRQDQSPIPSVKQTGVKVP